MVVQITPQLLLLAGDVGEVDEEPGAHVLLETAAFLRPGRLVSADVEVAVLEEAAATDLFRLAGVDHLILQMFDSLKYLRGLKGKEETTNRSDVPEHALDLDDGVRGVEVVDQGIEGDLEGVDGELELSPHLVHELQLDALAEVVVQREQGPPVVFPGHL